MGGMIFPWSVSSTVLETGIGASPLEEVTAFGCQKFEQAYDTLKKNRSRDLVRQKKINVLCRSRWWEAFRAMAHSEYSALLKESDRSYSGRGYGVMKRNSLVLVEEANRTEPAFKTRLGKMMWEWSIRQLPRKDERQWNILPGWIFGTGTLVADKPTM